LTAVQETNTHGQTLDIRGLFVGFITGMPRLFFVLAASLFGASSSDKLDDFLPLIILAVLLLVLFFSWLSWRRFRYYVEADEIRIESGLLSRIARSIPYDRIQDVSIEQKLLARVLGIAEVNFETGSGKGDEGKLSFVSMDEAERLRELVRAHKSDDAAQDSPITDGVEQDVPPIYAMDIKRIVTLGCYSFSLVIFAVLFGTAQQFDFLLPFDLWDFSAWIGIAKDNTVSMDTISWGARIIGAIFAMLGLIVLGFGTGIVRTLLRDYGFRLDKTDKGFRRRRGLLTLTDTVMPLHRVQAAIIQTGPIRKWRGWHMLQFVSLASDGADPQKKDNDHVAAPLATQDEILRITRAARIELPHEGAHFINGKGLWWAIQFLFLAAILLGIVAALLTIFDATLAAYILLIILPVLAAIYYFDWRNNRYARDEDQLFVRGGWWQERLMIAPQIKIQSVEITQGPIARYCGLAKMHLGLAGGTMQIIALPLADARALQRAISDVAAKVDYSDLNTTEQKPG
jgi:putative membrane protein